MAAQPQFGGQQQPMMVDQGGQTLYQQQQQQQQQIPQQHVGLHQPMQGQQMQGQQQQQQQQQMQQYVHPAPDSRKRRRTSSTTPIAVQGPSGVQGHVPPSANVAQRPDQDMRKLDLQVEALSLQHKFYKLAPYTPCLSTMFNAAAETQCSCQGWTNPKKLPGNSDSKLIPGPETPCAKCGHSLSDHGLLYSIPERDITYRVQIVFRMERTYNSCSGLDKAQQKQQLLKVRSYRQLLSKLVSKPPPVQMMLVAPHKVHTAFSSASVPEPPPMATSASSLQHAHVAPYESPCVLSFLQAFHKVIGHAGPFEGQKAKSVKVLKLVYRLLEGTAMLQPDMQEQQFPDLIAKSTYRTQYVLWKTHKLGPRKSENCIRVFGRSWLQCMFPHFCRTMLQNIKQLAPDSEQEMKFFLVQLQGQIYKDSKLWGSHTAKRANDKQSAMVRQKLAEAVVTMPARGPVQDKPMTAAFPRLFGVSGHASSAPQQLVPHESTSTANRAVCLSRQAVQAHLTEEGRESRARKEHASGEVTFKIVTNAAVDRGTGDIQPPTTADLIYLSGLKTLFARALPNMPKEYITRTVFDTKHKTLALLKKDTVIGGICFRMFKPQNFLEIVFCAISSQEQVKGYGTYLMNHLKAYASANECMNFLTFADNRAIGYFKKQGFTSSIKLPTSQTYGYIKNYDGGTLMQCALHPKIYYHNLPAMFQEQRKTVEMEIRKRESAGIRRPGLKCFDNGTTFIPLSQIPGVLQAGWKEEQQLPASEVPTKDLLKWMQSVVRDVKAHSSAWPFQEPVSREDVPDYYDVIKQPMDLKTIQNNVKSQLYSTREALLGDLTLMLDNCRKYNSADTPYYQCANELQEYLKLRAM